MRQNCRKASASSAVFVTLSSSLTTSDATNDLFSASATLYPAATAASSKVSPRLQSIEDRDRRLPGPDLFWFAVLDLITHIKVDPGQSK